MENLPEQLSLEVDADVDGEILFEWHRDKNNTFAISINEDGRAAYSGLFDNGEVCGEENILGDKVPETLLGFIDRVS